MGTRSKSTTRLKTQSGRSWSPHAYQRKAMRFMLERPHAALFLDPGLGKTSITYGVFQTLKKQNLSTGMLVLAPLRVALSVWPGERDEWREFQDLSVAVLHRKGKEQVWEKHDVYVVNFEGLHWLLESGALQFLLKEKMVDTLVVDELSKFKHTNTKRFKMLKPWLHKFKRRYGLTGSPAANGLMDLFGQVYVLDRGVRLGEYITHFRANYFIPVGMYDWKPKPGADEAIYKALGDLALRMEAEDYLELPKQVDNVIQVELPPKARRAYDAMEDEMLAVVEDSGSITAPTAAAAVGKCRQMANGAVYKDRVDPVTGLPLEKKEWVHLHDAKIDALLDLVDELQGKPLLVAYEYGHDLERLLKALPKGTPYIGGGVNATRAAEIERAWNAGEIPILLGHPQSIGHGLNLQKGNAQTICWFSLTWDFELYDQFNRRLRRQGNRAGQVFVHHIVARNTIDRAVLGALRGKKRTQDALLEALKKRRK